MVHGDCCVTLIVLMSFGEEILTLTFPFNVLIGHQKQMMTLAFTMNALIGQFNCHMKESLAYLTNSEFLLCNSQCGPRLAMYNLTHVT